MNISQSDTGHAESVIRRSFGKERLKDCTNKRSDDRGHPHGERVTSGQIRKKVIINSSSYVSNKMSRACCVTKELHTQDNDFHVNVTLLNRSR